jgi:hypothetical protein
MRSATLFLACSLLTGLACAMAPSRPTLDSIAHSYVKLALAAGAHDADYVDAYYGPPEWKAEADKAKRPLRELRRAVQALRQDIAAIDPSDFDAITQLRHKFMAKQLRALDTRLAIVGGQKFPFDEESLLVFDAVAPEHTAAHFDAVLAELDRALPGAGAVAARYQAFRNQFVIPRDKLDAVFRAAIAEARARTLQHITLPANESFRLEYVTNKSWSGYNWFQGNAASLIQINTDLPIFIDRAVDLAAHEGYPGHHVYSTLLEQKLMKGRGWMEFSINPLFGPNGVIAEGSANYGIDVVFPGAERLDFERRVLFPLAGLDPRRVEEYYRVMDITRRLGFAGNEAARRYLDGEINAAQAAAWLERYSLMEPARAQQRVKFIEQYRSYVINYNYGQQLVADFVEAAARGDPAKRWAVFTDLISTPRLPSGLR